MQCSAVEGGAGRRVHTIPGSWIEIPAQANQTLHIPRSVIWYLSGKDKALSCPSAVHRKPLYMPNAYLNCLPDIQYKQNAWRIQKGIHQRRPLSLILFLRSILSGSPKLFIYCEANACTITWCSFASYLFQSISKMPLINWFRTKGKCILVTPASNGILIEIDRLMECDCMSSGY